MAVVAASAKLLALGTGAWHGLSEMSTREALIQEIEKLPEPVLREVRHYLAFLLELERRESNGKAAQPTDSWPEGYFERTAGAFAGEPFERPPQLPFEKREEW